MRARKGWKHAGNLIAHFGIILMLIAGGLAHHFEVRGNMAIEPGKSNDVAEDYFEHVVEISEVDEMDQVTKIHVIRGEHVMDLRNKSRIIRLPNLPFDLELAGYLLNAKPVHHREHAAKNGERVIDGYYLWEDKPEVEAERNTGGCYARAVDRDGIKSDPFILSALSFYHHTFEHEGKSLFNMRKRLWPMPFELRLDEFRAEFHPGTKRPAEFVSEVTKIESDIESEITIQMNEPLRYEGLTFYQASYGPQGAGPDQKLFTVLEVVSNQLTDGRNTRSTLSPLVCSSRSSPSWSNFWSANPANVPHDSLTFHFWSLDCGRYCDARFCHRHLPRGGR